MNTASDIDRVETRSRQKILLRRGWRMSAQLLWATALLSLLPLKDTQPISAEGAYSNSRLLFLHGYLERSQQEAERGYRQSRISDPSWAPRFQLLEAEAMEWRGMYEDALRLLDVPRSAFRNEDAVQKLTAEGVALTHLHQFSEANEKLTQAESICESASYGTCGGVLRARGVFAMEQGQLAEARLCFIRSLSFAQAHHDQLLETTAFSGLGFVSLQNEHYDEAVDWSMSAYRAAVKIDAEDMAQVASGNLGWAYFELGDKERALNLFLDAQKRASKLGDVRFEIKWLTTAAYVYQDIGDSTRSAQFYRQALSVAKRIKSKEDIVNLLEDLAHASIDDGKLDEAAVYLQQLGPMVLASGNRLDALDVKLAEARIEAATHRYRDAEKHFREVEKDPASQTSMRLGAEHALAQLYESEGDDSGADRMYRTCLTTFESARREIKNEESKLPFLANATGVYDDYIHFLVKRGKVDDALSLADQSRARTLEQGLGLGAINRPSANTSLHPAEVSRKTNATLLFYWLGDKQSYLWAVTPRRTAMYVLPPRKEIVPMVERYRNALLGLGDPAESSNADGLALYRILVAPAQELITSPSNVVILSDGELSQLNFETLIVPDGHPHYWIEDATLISAPSIAMLGSAKASDPSSKKLLLVGDAVPPNSDYPELPKAASEMEQIQLHFKPVNERVFARELATAESYLSSSPQQFAFIHFVAHGVASRTDPLDSAIILSRSSTAEDSFKLHAREIIQHPIHARLVTISACYGSGTRSYAGEGLVGLAWAFLRAGAHNVIGALWEVSDESTPRLMGSLYQGLQDGLPPGAALRQAKLALLHSSGEFRKPFFWAPLQIYTGL